jgi:DNA-binding transcriptional MerR regulator
MVVDRSTRALTVEGVARLLRVRRNTVRRWSEMGLIQSNLIGARGDRLFLWEDINGFLESLTKP